MLERDTSQLMREAGIVQSKATGHRGCPPPSSFHNPKIHPCKFKAKKEVNNDTGYGTGLPSTVSGLEGIIHIYGSHR